MPQLSRAVLVARREFVATVARPGFVFAVLALPVTFAGLIGVLALVGRPDADSLPRRVGIVDSAGVMGPGALPARVTAKTGGAIAFELVASPDDGRRGVQQRRLAACYILGADYHTTGEVTALRAPPRSPIDFGVGLDEREALAELLRSRLTAGQPDEKRRLIVEPIQRVRLFSISEAGDMVAVPDSIGLVRAFLGPFGLAFFLSLGIFFSAGFLEQATSEERESRLLEVILTMTAATNFVTGKVLGLAAVGLVQIVVYAGFAAAAGSALAGLVQFAPGQIAWSILYFLLGYFFFASLLAGTAIVVRSAQESLQLATVLTSVSAVPIVVMLFADPNGGLARALSYVPLTAPVTMLLRIGRGDVPAVDRIGAAVVIALATCAALWASAQLMRASMQMQGKPLTLATLAAWLRAR